MQPECRTQMLLWNAQWAMCYIVFFLRKTKLLKCSWRQSKVMDTIRQRDVGLGEKMKQVWGRERLREGRWITVWQVKWKSRRGCLERCEECVRCGLAQHSVWVIHHTNTARGHSLAQRYAEQEENNVLRLHPAQSDWNTQHRGYIYSPPTSTLYKSSPGLYILRDNPRKQKQKTDTWVLHHRRGRVYCNV